MKTFNDRGAYVRIGVDIGGTNTDAVLMRGQEVVAIAKTPTTDEVSIGMMAAIAAVLEQSALAPNAVDGVMVGTTHFTNAFVQRRGLAEVGIVRLALPAANAVPPLSDWPSDLVSTLGNHVAMVSGGYEYDGTSVAELDASAVASVGRRFRRLGLKAIAVSCVFSPVNGAMEKRAAAILREECPDAQITLSSTIGRVGLLARENAGVMNASLAHLARETIGGLRRAFARLGMTAPLYISQNDGTLMTWERAQAYPVLTFASGPTNSMRGAAHLSGLRDAMVADIGGTTTDIGVLRGGFPRESSIAVDIGGVRTNFRMPDVLSVGLGGGSLVDPLDGARVGPRSVGHRLSREALVFGGNTLTASDIAVAAGYHCMGNPARVAHLDAATVGRACRRIHELIADGIDRMKASCAREPLVLVGGGKVLVRDSLAGVGEVIVPEHAAVANAIGAAIAQVSGEVDRVYAYDEHGRERTLDGAKRLAMANAVKAGAAAETVRVIDVEELPLAYIPGGAVRVRVKAAGELALRRECLC